VSSHEPVDYTTKPVYVIVCFRFITAMFLKVYFAEALLPRDEMSSARNVH
jgi:hypothetical protein